MKPRTTAAVLVVAALLLISGLVALEWYRAALRPVDAGGEATLVRIPEGGSTAQIAQLLSEQGLIRDERAFSLMLRLESLAGTLQAGVFELSPAMSAREIARWIASGQVATVRVTVPEGLTLEQIAARIAATGVVESAEAFVAGAHPSAVADAVEMPLPADTLEGYLFPETYEFTYDDGPERIAARMVRELQERFVKPNREAIAARGLSLHEIITLASLVEREAKVDEERSVIAGVIQNRLERGMKLQIDATVQYALGEHRERLLYEDLEVESPYNTYLHAGLPPGPIASPGLPSLQAALRPAETDALFYVARPDGTHVFTNSYEEHLQAIERIRGR